MNMIAIILYLAVSLTAFEIVTVFLGLNRLIESDGPFAVCFAFLITGATIGTLICTRRIFLGLKEGKSIYFALAIFWFISVVLVGFCSLVGVGTYLTSKDNRIIDLITVGGSLLCTIAPIAILFLREEALTENK